MRVRIVGAGGREMALAWRLVQDPSLTELQVTRAHPGWPSGAVVVDALSARPTDLVVIGPEKPLARGIADTYAQRGVPCFGPTAAAARLEASKSWAKDVMHAAGVPTAKHHVMTLADPELPVLSYRMAESGVVLKADGLAGGKGAFVCHDRPAVDRALSALRALESHTVVVEQALFGVETSVFGLTDGTRVVGLPSARDYKRLSDGDTGPNTGGMGAIAPDPNLNAGQVDDILDRVHRPIIAELRRRGIPYRGVLYAGLMLTPSGPKVLEFNVRFGDPECQVLMALWTDPLRWLHGAATGQLPADEPHIESAFACGVVLAASGYPASPVMGATVPTPTETPSSTVFQAGVTGGADHRRVSGGRVLSAVGWANTASEARRHAYELAETMRFDGVQFRRDIGESL